jgi:hypothetical protein
MHLAALGKVCVCLEREEGWLVGRCVWVCVSVVVGLSCTLLRCCWSTSGRGTT